MKIKQLHFTNFKSLKDITIENPNPFTVFVGPNASGKSNIFEAIEFFNFCGKINYEELFRHFGGVENFVRRTNEDETTQSFFVNFKDIHFPSEVIFQFVNGENGLRNKKGEFKYIGPKVKVPKDWENEFKDFSQDWLETIDYKQFFNSYSRIFIKNKEVEKIPFKDDKALSVSCDNLEPVLKRVLKNKAVANEITEILQLLIPGFEKLEIRSEELSKSDVMLVYETGSDKPFPKQLLSDGTFNIIALLTALFQRDEPQFLCIEEPENGLNPFVVKELVNIFRDKCEEKGHFIWLNTHSQTLVSELRPEEIILVDKKEGETKITQLKGVDLHGLKMDEAWLTNALGGGTPW